jgi:hypothetical protein
VDDAACSARLNTITQRASFRPGTVNSRQPCARHGAGKCSISSRGHLPFIARTRVRGPHSGAIFVTSSGRGDDSVEHPASGDFNPPMQPFDIDQAECAGRVLYKTDFLAVGIDEREAPLGVEHRQGQARKTRARANISHRRALQLRMNRQAVQQVMSQHFIAIADRCQVVSAVPALELVEQPHEASGIRLGERDTQSRGALNQAFDYAQDGLL